MIKYSKYAIYFKIPLTPEILSETNPFRFRILLFPENLRSFKETINNLLKFLNLINIDTIVNLAGSNGSYDNSSRIDGSNLDCSCKNERIMNVSPTCSAPKLCCFEKVFSYYPKTGQAASTIAICPNFHC